MAADQQPPLSPSVKSYAGGIQARNAARQEERRQNPVLPNLGQAAVSYRPSTGTQTIEQMGEEQRRFAPDERPPAPLSEGTVEGLRMLHEAQAKATAAQPPPAAAPAPREEEPAKPEEESPEVDDEFLEAVRGAQQDVIQTNREKAAVAARVKPIDLAEGLVDGQFTQVVPIVPDKLHVKYRCLTPGENNAIRMFLFDEIKADPRKNNLAGELLAFYQTVATVMSFNSTHYQPHMVATGQFGRLEFQPQVFEQKIATFLNFPLPLISALGTHAAWFEMRVRELFVTADRIKNG